MIPGRTAVAVRNDRARGVRFCDLPAFSLPTSTSAAPSTMPELLPPVWTWLIFSIQWYFCSATSSKPPISPMPSNAVFSFGQALHLGVGAACCSSWSRMTRPFWSLTDHGLGKYPPDHAAAAFSCERSA